MKPRVSCRLDAETVLVVQFTIKQSGGMDFGSVMNQVLFIRQEMFLIELERKQGEGAKEGVGTWLKIRGL